MVDEQIIMGAGVAIAGLVFGAGLVAFTEKQGQRTAERGGITDDVSNACTIVLCCSNTIIAFKYYLDNYNNVVLIVATAPRRWFSL